MPAKTTPGTGTGAIQTYLGKPRLDVLAQTQQGQQFAILALTSKDILLMEMLHHLTVEGVWARWLARFLPNLIQGEVGTIPEDRRLECCAGTLAGREHAGSDGFRKDGMPGGGRHIREEIR